MTSLTTTKDSPKMSNNPDANDDSGLVNPEAVVMHRLFRAWRMQRAYYEAGRVYDALHVFVGIVALVANGIVLKGALGADAFTAGIAGVVSIIFVAIQTS